MTWRWPILGVIVPQLPGRATAQGTLNASGSGPYTVNTQITAPGGTQARIAGSLARDFATANLNIDGAAPLNLANSFIEPNLLNGTAQLNLSLNGPLAVSSLSGNVTVRGAEMVLPGPALSLNGLDLDARLGGNRVDLVLDASLSTRGTIRTTGTIGLTAPYQADLAVQLQNLLLEDRRLYQATAGGSVTVQGRCSPARRSAATSSSTRPRSASRKPALGRAAATSPSRMSPNPPMCAQAANAPGCWSRPARTAAAPATCCRWT